MTTEEKNARGTFLNGPKEQFGFLKFQEQHNMSNFRTTRKIKPRPEHEVLVRGQTLRTFSSKWHHKLCELFSDLRFKRGGGAGGGGLQYCRCLTRGIISHNSEQFPFFCSHKKNRPHLSGSPVSIRSEEGFQEMVGLGLVGD